MPDNDNNENRRMQLRAICDRLGEALGLADELEAHLLAAKIEDSRLCVAELIDALR